MELGELWIALLAGLILVEFRAWRPLVCRVLLRLAAIFAPTRHRRRLAEEWAANIEDFPGDLAKLLFAFGCVLAGFKLTMLSWVRLAHATVVFIAVSGPGFIGMYQAGLGIGRLPKKLLKNPQIPPQVIALTIATKTTWLLYRIFVLGHEPPPRKVRKPKPIPKDTA